MFTEKERALPLEDPNLPILFPDTVHLQWIFASFLKAQSFASLPGLDCIIEYI